MDQEKRKSSLKYRVIALEKNRTLNTEIFNQVHYLYATKAIPEKGRNISQSGDKANRTPITVMQTQCNAIILYPLFVFDFVFFACL